MQAASTSTDFGISYPVDFDSSTGSISSCDGTHMQTTTLIQSSVPELSQVAVNATAPSKPEASRAINVGKVSGQHRMDPYWGYVHNHQRAEPTFDKPERQMAVATAAPTAHETAKQHATGQSQADVSELERPIQRQLNAASQPASAHSTTTTIVASGGPRMAAHSDHLDNHQGAGSTFCCREPEILAVAGPSTPHQAELQPQLEASDPERLLELQQSESDDGGSSPVVSYEVAPDPYLDLPSPSHHLAYVAHESPMHGSDTSLSPPSSPHAFPPPGLLLHLHLIPSFSDLMAAYAPELLDFEEPEADEFDELMNLAETLEELNPPGMSQAEIECLESYQFIPQVDELETAFCVVCRSHYQAQELVLVLPCGHEFHSSCAEQWLQISRTCPICRRNASN